MITENYYMLGEVETIEVIKVFCKYYYGVKAFALGNAIKYLSRAGKKKNNSFNDDIDKAIYYLRLMGKDNNGVSLDEEETKLYNRIKPYLGKKARVLFMVLCGDYEDAREALKCLKKD